MRTNRKPKLPKLHTHEGAPAKRVNAELQLRRSLMACMLWENEFYESGEDIADRITSLVAEVDPNTVSGIADEARTIMKLRHAPLLVAVAMARLESHRPFVRPTLAQIIQRADEPAEFLSLYWKDGKVPVAKQVRLGLSDALNKFNEYQFAKYNRDGSVKLRDVLRIVHPTPKDKAQSRLFKKILDDTLETPETWETQLSKFGGVCDKKEIWTNLIKLDRLGAMALLRNLRNMTEAGVSRGLIGEALENLDPSRVLPFRFISAARHAPQFEPELEIAMFSSLEQLPKLRGRTTLLIDVSGSMEEKVSGRSEITRMDAACGLAMMLRERCDKIDVCTFSQNVVEVPPRRGFALRDAIVQSQPHSSTYLGAAIQLVEDRFHNDRLIVISDEQSHDQVMAPEADLPYMINVASNQNGVGYGKWLHIDGWSDAVVDYIVTYENLE